MITAVTIVHPFETTLLESLRIRLTNQGIRFLCPKAFEVNVSHIHRMTETCSLVVGERVQYLQLTIDEEDGLEETLSALQGLPKDRYPLEYLKIDMVAYGRFESWDGLQCATLFARLLSLDYQGPLHMDSWQLLSKTCPKLKDIRLVQPENRSPDLLELSNPASTLLPIIFPSLETLDVRDCRKEMILAVSLISNMPQLTHLSASLHGGAQAFQDHARLAHHFQENSPLIETLDTDTTSFGENYFVFPLFGELRKLKIHHINLEQYPTDEDMETIAQGLPHLEQLVLETFDDDPLDEWRDWVIYYGLTFEGILSIAKHCKEIKELHVALDARDFDIPYPFIYFGPTFPALKKLTLPSIWISRGRAKWVAYYIRGMAPFVSKFTHELHEYRELEPPYYPIEDAWCEEPSRDERFKDVVEGRPVSRLHSYGSYLI